MAVDYAKFATLAQTLIQANGRALTIILRSRAAADASKPWNGPSATPSSSISVFGVIDTDQEVDPKGDLVRNGQKVAYIAALDTDPALVEQYDVLTDGIETWKIQSVDTIAPGPTRVLYTLKLAS